MLIIPKILKQTPRDAKFEGTEEGRRRRGGVKNIVLTYLLAVEII